MGIEVERTTHAGPDVVWGVLTNLEGSVDVLTGVTAVERLTTGSNFEPGLRWRETREMFGREASEELEITAVEPGRSYTVEADSDGTHYRSVVRVEPEGAGSRISMTFEAEVGGGRLARLMARTMAKSFEKATRNALQQDLDDIAEAAEAAATGA